MPPKPKAGEQVFILTVPYEERSLASAAGARWFPGTGWAYVGTALPKGLLEYAPKPYSWDAWLSEDFSGSTHPTPTPDSRTGTFDLRTDQLQDVKSVLMARKAGAPEFLVGNDVGTGKTLTAIAAIKRMSKVKNVLVVCPLTVAPNWRLHLDEMGDGGKRWCIINYESAKRLLDPPASAANAKSARTKNLQTARSGKSKVEWDVVIVDESHYCFPGDSLVSTEQGDIEIARLVQMSPGQRPRVYSQARDGNLALRRVTEGMTSPSKPLVRVVHESGEFVSTEDHPVFTGKRGYVPAGSLCGLDDGPDDADVLTVLPEDVQGVHQSVRDPQSQESVLFAALPVGGVSEATPGASGEQGLRTLRGVVQRPGEEPGQNVQSVVPDGLPGEDGSAQASGLVGLRVLSDRVQAEGADSTDSVLHPVLRSAPPHGRDEPSRPSEIAGSSGQDARQQGAMDTYRRVEGSGFRSDERGQEPNSRPSSGGEDTGLHAGADLHRTRRERQDYSAAADGSRPDWVADGARDHVAEAVASGSGGVPPAHQVLSGPGGPGDQDGYRDRREEPSHQEVALPGSAEGTHPGSSRVVRVEVLELGRGLGPEGGSQGDQVYNLSVEEDENYFVNGVLVHNCSNPESQRTRMVDKIIVGTNGRPAFTVRMSATAGANPAELSYLHRGMAWSTGRKPKAHISADEYVQWCEDQGFSVTKGGFGNSLKWEPPTEQEGEVELKRLSALLFQGDPQWGIRRRPDWPEQQRIPMPVELSEQEREAYQADWAEFKDAMKRIDREKKANASKSMSRKARARADAQARTKGLAAMTRYRQKAGQVRAPGTAEFAVEMIRKGKQVAISCEYIGTVNALFEELQSRRVRVVTYTGENRDTREEDRIAYQTGEAQAIIYTPTEGFSLHAGEHAVGGNDVPRATIVAEPRWSPKKALQAEGRSQRDGKSAPVHYMYALGTIEEKVIKKVIWGMRNTTLVNGEDTTPFNGLAETLDVPFLVAA